MIFPIQDDIQLFVVKAVRFTDVHNDELIDLYQNLDDDLLYDFAEVNEVESIVGHRLLSILGEAHTPVRWREAHQRVFDAISSYLVELDRIAAVFKNEGITLIALKNGGIARGIYPDPGSCPMGDIDVFVEKSSFRTAHRILIDEGYEFEFNSDISVAEIDWAERSGGTEYRKALPDGGTLWFELQWRPVAGRWIRPDQELSGLDLVARSIPIEGSDVRLLNPVDNLLQVSLHTTKHSYVRAPGFRLHTDVDRIVRSQEIDWRFFIEQVLRLQVKTSVYFSLKIPVELLETPIPDEVLSQLRPPEWKERLITRWLRHAGIFTPKERKFSSLRYILFSASLYDDFRGLWRGIVPDPRWMRDHYGLKSNLQMPVCYFKRLLDLIFRRENI